MQISSTKVCDKVGSVADEENWTEPEADGLMYLFSDGPECPFSQARATGKTFLKYSILKRKLDELNGWELCIF